MLYIKFKLISLSLLISHGTGIDFVAELLYTMLSHYQRQHIVICDNRYFIKSVSILVPQVTRKGAGRCCTLASKFDYMQCNSYDCINMRKIWNRYDHMI